MILINGLEVINLAYSLNATRPASPSINSCKFPNKWPTKKRQRKRPVRAMAYFLDKEDFRIPVFLIVFLYLVKVHGATPMTNQISN